MSYKEADLKFEKGWMWINGKKFRQYPFKGKEDFFEMIEFWEEGGSVARIEKIYHMQKTKFKLMRQALGMPIQHGGLKLRGKELEKRERFVQNVFRDLKNNVSVLDIIKKRHCSIMQVRHLKMKYEKLNNLI